jgi:hypothetical protein
MYAMATLTTWEADKGGFFQGSGTPGEVVGRAIDWALDKIRKLPKLPKPKPFTDHWTQWPEGNPIEVTERWRNDMIAKGRLPGEDHVEYRYNRPERAEMLSMSGSHVIVEMLDTDRKTRHRCMQGPNILIASREGWEASQKAAAA